MLLDARQVPQSKESVGSDSSAPTAIFVALAMTPGRPEKALFISEAATVAAHGAKTAAVVSNSAHLAAIAKAVASALQTPVSSKVFVPLSCLVSEVAVRAVEGVDMMVTGRRPRRWAAEKLA